MFTSTRLESEARRGTTEQQCQDAATISEFSLSLEQGAVWLAFQSVVAVGAADGVQVQTLYSEVLTRLGQVGGGASCGKVIQALERMDQIAWYDMLVLDTVLDLLETYPHINLGCNLSALTLRKMEAWEFVLMRLQVRPAMARRLTLEITETAVLPDTNQALQITGALQGLGCKIAIDDLGKGRTALAFVDDCRPGIIKIDRSALQPREDDASGSLLKALVRLSAHLSPCVVVEGVDNEEFLHRAVNAGANAVQGYFVEKPRLRPSWLPVSASVQLNASRRRPSVQGALRAGGAL